MKVLVMYTTQLSYEPRTKNLDNVAELTEGASFSDCLLAFIQAEKEDEEKDLLSSEKKLTNHLKWTLRKNNTNKIILHSFAHLSDSKASATFTKDLLDATEARLKNAGCETAQTPFGYFLDLDIKAPGYSLARIWATL